MFLHVHKAAGSTICQLALDAGELVNRDNNCNLVGAAKRALAAGTTASQCAALRYGALQHQCWVGLVEPGSVSNNWSALWMIALYRNSPYTFVANERGLADDPWWDGDALYVTVLREPRQRTVSQYLHLKRYADAYLVVRHMLLMTLAAVERSLR